MDISGLLTVPNIIVLAFVAIFSALAGFVIGWSREATHKAQALSRAEKMHESAMAKLGAGHRDRIAVLSKSSADEIENLKRLHGERVAQLGQEHQGQIDDLKSGHSGEITRLGNEHKEMLRQLNEANNTRMAELKKQQEQEIARIEGDAATARAGLEQAIEVLNGRIVESRHNNMFSVAKSGDKLVQVVRSVQELASELDETSRTVTDGEYSFFNEIKDQRDRETVLRLAGEGETRNGEPREEDQPQPHAQAVAAGDPGLQEQDRA